MKPQFISALQNVILILQCITLVSSVIALIVTLGRNVQNESTIDNNSWSPEAYPQGWKEITE